MPSPTSQLMMSTLPLAVSLFQALLALAFCHVFVVVNSTVVLAGACATWFRLHLPTQKAPLRWFSLADPQVSQDKRTALSDCQLSLLLGFWLLAET